MLNAIRDINLSIKRMLCLVALCEFCCRGNGNEDMESHFSLDVPSATGYLEDAIAGWSLPQQTVEYWLDDLQHLDDRGNHFLDITSMDNFLSKDYGVKKIAYPFDMVKRGGFEGHATLEDINYRLLMPPTRPIRHPVGDLAAAPCISAGGFGMSGKVIVALTKIHSQGRGTITVIRTKS